MTDDPHFVSHTSVEAETGPETVDRDAYPRRLSEPGSDALLLLGLLLYLRQHRPQLDDDVEP